jgi:uncharacterized repeat protein (TIGR01451 family)
MHPNTRLAAYLLVLGALAGLLIAGPRAWATPEQRHAAQTVPTVTPRSSPRPTVRPTDQEPPTGTVAPPGTEAPGGTPVPAGTVSLTVAPAAQAGAALVLTKEAGLQHAWLGATIPFTLTLSNLGTASARQVVVIDVLPAELDPGPLEAGTGATWDARTLRLGVPVLAPGGRAVIAFTARVNGQARTGGVITNVANATAAGGLTALASMSVAMPPAELPPTGGPGVGPPVYPGPE